MSAESSHSDRWTDRQLRDVPLPAGLLDRLRQVVSGSDVMLDELLREVVLPAGLLASLRMVPVETDAGLDERVCAVEAPASLSARLKRIPLAADADLNEAIADVELGSEVRTELSRRLKQIAWDTDDGLDEALRSVTVPAELSAALKRIARVGVAARSAASRRRRRSRVLHAAAAAVVLVAVLASYVAGMANLILDTYHVALLERPHLDAAGSLEGSIGEPSDVELPPVEFAVDPHRPLREWLDSFDPQPEPELPSAIATTDDPWPWPFAPPLDVRPLGLWGPRFASPPASERFDRIESPRGVYPRGQLPPAVGATFDWAFYAQFGVKPFVSPAADPQLAAARVPLGTDTCAFDRVLEQVSQGRWPRADEVFVDDFLAAMDYRFPPPDERAMAIRTAAGPSPFSADDRPMWLLQVAAQALDKLPGNHPPVRLTVVVDVSAGMADGERLEQVRRALGSLSDQLRGDDRVALIAFGDQARIVAEDIGPESRGEWLRAIESLKVLRQTANIGEGLRTGCSLASLPTPAQQRRLVVISDSLPYLSGETAARIERMARETHQRGVQIDWIDVGRQLVHAPLLERLATSAEVRLHLGVSERQIRRPLLSAVAGRDAIVAGDASLQVRFNPKVVARYRTIGGEPDVQAAPQQVDVWVGEVSSGLFELEFHPGASGPVGEAELIWRDPQGGGVRKLVQPISRRQFADTFVAAGPSLQLAALAAETAEVLQSSKMAQGSSLDQVLRQADQTTATLRRWPSYRRLIGLLQQAEQARRRSVAPVR